jgi:hypothetical protein
VRAPGTRVALSSATPWAKATLVRPGPPLPNRVINSRETRPAHVVTLACSVGVAVATRSLAINVGPPAATSFEAQRHQFTSGVMRATSAATVPSRAPCRNVLKKPRREYRPS